MHKFMASATRMACVLTLASIAPAYSGTWDMIGTTYTPFNTPCIPHNFSFWDNYAFVGLPVFYTWPAGNNYPCALTVSRSSTGGSIARAALVSVGDRLQGSATAQSSPNGVNASMSGNGLYSESWQHSGDCFPYIVEHKGSCRIAGSVSGTGVASGFAQLMTSFSNLFASVDVQGPSETFELNSVYLPAPVRAPTGFYFFAETTGGTVFASASGAGSIGRAELRAEVFILTELSELCFSRHT